jgi:HK97 family phage major capsid protein
MTIEELRARLEAIQGERRSIHAAAGEAALSAEQQVTWDALDTEETDLSARVGEAEEVEARSERVRASRAKYGSLQMGAGPTDTKRDAFENVAELRFNAANRYAPDIDGDQAIISRAVTAFTDKAYRVRGVTDKQLETLVDKIENIPGAARHALIHGSPAYRSGFKSYLQSQGNPIYTAEEAVAVRTALSLTGANGGYTLPTLLDPTLIHTGTATKNPLRSIARVISGTQNVWHGVSTGNVTTYWKAEGSAFTEGSPTLASPSITAAMLTAYLTASYEIFEDSDLQSQLPGLIGESMGYAEGTAFVVGSGSTAPKGIITAISATAGSTVTATTRGAFTTASAVDIFAVLNAVPSRYEDTATWLANKATFNTVKQMSTGSQGSYFWTDFNSAIGNPLLGSPIVQSSDMATAQTSGTILAVLGDFSQFVIYDRIGLSVEFMQNVVDGSGLPTGQRGLVAHKRVGSDCTDINAFRFLKT